MTTKLSTQASPQAMQAFRAALSDGFIQSLERAIPEHARGEITAERIITAAKTAFDKTPALWACNPRAICRCLMEAAQLGVEPSAGGNMVQAYLLPYKEECSLSVAWQGWLAIARRTKAVSKISARCVYAGDDFQFSHGLDHLDFVHRPQLDGERGQLRGVYCLWRQEDSWHIQYLSRADIEEFRKVSPAGQNGPWGKWYDQMALKSVIKRAAKWWPKTAATGDVFDAIERAEDVTATPIDPPKGASDAIADKLSARAGETIVRQHKRRGRPPKLRQVDIEDAEIKDANRSAEGNDGVPPAPAVDPTEHMPPDYDEWSEYDKGPE